MRIKYFVTLYIFKHNLLMYLQQTDVNSARKSEEAQQEVASQLELRRCKGAQRQEDRGKAGPSSIPQGGQCTGTQPEAGYPLAREGASTKHNYLCSTCRTK
jgi:hypothetical protein